MWSCISIRLRVKQRHCWFSAIGQAHDLFAWSWLISLRSTVMLTQCWTLWLLQPNTWNILLRTTNSFNEAQVVLYIKLPRGLARLKTNLSGYFYKGFKLLDCRVVGIKVSSYTKSRMGYPALNSLEIWDRVAHVIYNFWWMERYIHVHCVCGGSEPEYTSDRKDFILGPRLEGGTTIF